MTENDYTTMTIGFTLIFPQNPEKAKRSGNVNPLLFKSFANLMRDIIKPVIILPLFQ